MQRDLAHLGLARLDMRAQQPGRLVRTAADHRAQDLRVLVVGLADPVRLRLSLQPYVSLLALHHAVDDYVLAVKQRDRALRAAASRLLTRPFSPACRGGAGR